MNFLSHILFDGCKELPADSNKKILQGAISCRREIIRFNQHVNDVKQEFCKIVGEFSTILSLL